MGLSERKNPVSLMSFLCWEFFFLSKRSVYLSSPFHPVPKGGELGFAGDAGVVDVPLPIDKLASHSNPLDAGNQYALFICIILCF